MPAVSVTVSVTVKVPAAEYECEMVGEVLVAVAPSPKFQENEAIDPTGALEVLASKEVLCPALAAVVEKDAVGAWSGSMAMAFIPLPPKLDAAAPVMLPDRAGRSTYGNDRRQLSPDVQGRSIWREGIVRA